MKSEENRIYNWCRLSAVLCLSFNAYTLFADETKCDPDNILCLLGGAQENATSDKGPSSSDVKKASQETVKAQSEQYQAIGNAVTESLRSAASESNSLISRSDTSVESYDSSSNEGSGENARDSGAEERDIRGVKKIESNGKTSGVDSWVVLCHGGGDTVIFNYSGEWHTGYLGAMGPKYNSWSRDEVADYLCNK